MCLKQFHRWSGKLPSLRQGSGWRYFFREDVENFRAYLEPAPVVEVPAPPKGRRQGGGKGFWD